MDMFSSFSFGKEAESRKELIGNDELGTGILGIVGNIV